ncbi:MAG: 16S rRNA (uracil(1498)-N(3))-methyltransferase [Candidatus Nealsonbacteria bacterium]|nr:16S rRNA (uracil(1498)-N(3))-methyltransferase [Candidatus Nealsonbacteria bacterium]
MSDRYFMDRPIVDSLAVLDGAEAHHLIHVMRARPGTEIVLFDGSGAEFPARVERLGRAEVELSVLGRDEIDRELPRAVTLAVALPKGDRQRWLVEKATELGVARLVPLRTTRSVAQPVQQAIGRLRRAAIEASKQCGRNRLLEIAEPQAWPDFLADTAAEPCRLLAHPAEDAAKSHPLRAAHSTDPVLLAVGPEGGFTDEEVALGTVAGWQPVDLGPRILRTETAAILLAAIFGAS